MDDIERAEKEKREAATKALQILVGVRMKQARKRAGLSIDDVGARFQITRSAAGHWETGRNAISATDLAEFAEFVGVSCDSLIYGRSPVRFSNETERWARQLEQLPPEEREKVFDFLEYRLSRLDKSKQRAA